jgi:tetratricopeptide (TPR) repeat protein
MTRHRRSAGPVWVCGILLGLTLGPGRPPAAQEPDRGAPADPAAAEEAREQRAMQRYLALLEKNPRRGTALDRVYGYHVERGSLDALLKSYRDRLTKAPNDGAAGLILGLLEFQRGQDAAAVAALRQAETHRPEDALPAYYLGQALVLVGQPEQAAAAFERALQRKPPRNDLLEIFQALGRVYQRTQRADQALQVWGRLEALFPDDPRVQEQIASALAEEDQPAQALPRFETLARKVADPFRQVQLSMQAAELKVRLGRSDEALRDFERMLAKLRPDSWLHKEVRRKIEEVFLRNDDQAGLASYYERWTKKEPEDVEALVRLGRTLAGMGRVAEAKTWYEKAIKLAPSRRELRLALIGQLAQDQKYAEAADQYQALDRADPNNPDTLKDWGALVLRDPSKPQAERKAAAAAIWRKLLDARPNDPVTTAQVADLLRQAELVDDALALYRKAIEQAPGNPQYHEYLGEYLHNLKRPAEAVAAWEKLAQGPNRNAKSLGRLAEVLAGFGYLKEAIAPLKEAIALEPDDFNLRVKLAEVSHRLGQFDEAETQLAVADKLAERDEQREVVLQSRLKNDQAAGKIVQKIEALRTELEGGQGGTSERWTTLARYLEVDGKLPEAVRAAGRAIQANGRSIQAWTLAARVRESAGNLSDAADALRRLAELDRRNRSEYLTGIARLESRLGRVDAALRAGRDLIAATAAGVDQCEFFAQLCFQLGRPEEGLDALRRAVRANPQDTKAVLTLAETLAGQYQTEEAIEMYWRAFDRADELENKLDVVRRLTELYLQRNQVDRLLTRLQHQDREERPGANPSRGRDVALCTAQAYATSGDMGAARAELERLLAANTRDTHLLQQLSKLVEEEGDPEGAARYQKQLNELAPSEEAAARLGQLYARSGDLDEAQAVWSKMAAGQGASYHVYQAMDSLLMNQKPQPVVETTEAMVRKDPHDWEALYRQGAALAAMGKPEAAERSFHALLALTIPDDEKSVFSKARARDPRLQAPNAYPGSARLQATMPLEERLGTADLIRDFCGLENSTLTRRYSWGPSDFGQARMAAMGWIVSMVQKQGVPQAEGVVASFRKPAEKRPADLRASWDWLYLCAVRLDHAGAFAAAQMLSRAAPTEPLALWAYLHSLGGRQTPLGRYLVVARGRTLEENVSPLDKDELDYVLACLHALRDRRPELAQAEILQNVADELKRAGRADEETRFYREVVAGATQIGQVASALNLAAARGDVDILIELSRRYDRLQAGRSTYTYYTGSFRFMGTGLALSQGMSVSADRKAYGDLLRLLDFSLTEARQKMERQSKGAAARAARARFAALNRSRGAIRLTPYWSGSSYRTVRITFPEPNEYIDIEVIGNLRTAYELYKRDDLLSDLVGHYRGQVAAARSPGDAIYPRLALSSILWWNEEKDEAVAELTKVVEASRAESDLRLDLAELLESQREPAEALALVDAVQPLDNLSLKRREEVALRVAVSTGNIDRARQAAERLFGLRLDTETQITLSGQMHQLGLHELAEAVLGRARRRAGNKATALVGLMLQYQRQAKLDEAVQVAMQILRSTTANRQPTPLPILADDPEAARTSAIAVLARSGRLSQLIARATEQLKKTPNAVQIHQALADYYTAARQPAKARAELARIVELRPEDVDLRLRVASQLVQDGQADAAIEQYRSVFKKDPSQLGRISWVQLQTAFRQAGKSAELLQLFEESDLRSTISPRSFDRIIVDVPDDASGNERVVSFFRKVWAAFPEGRTELLTYARREAIWQMSEIYDYAREAMIPRSPSPASTLHWYPFLPTGSTVGATNLVEIRQSAASRLLDLAERRGRLDQLAGEIESARKNLPDWSAGDVLLALVRCRAGRYDEARVLTRRALENIRKDSIASTPVYAWYAAWALASELENHEATRELALTVYADSLDDPYSFLQFRFEQEKVPFRRLVNLYASEGRNEEARHALLKIPRREKFPDAYPEELIRLYRVFIRFRVAPALVELGYGSDAVPLFAEAIKLVEELPSLPASYFPNPEEGPRQLRDGLKAAIDGLSAAELAPIAGRLVSDASDDPNPESVKDHAKSIKAKARDQSLDLVTLVYPRDLDKARLRSMMAESLAACDPGQLAALDEPMEKLRKAHPEDLAIAIAIALKALASGDSKQIAPALDGLNRLVEQTPLEPLPPGGRANARQRAEAARQVPLWLVARACGKAADASGVRVAADRLAARAIEAARRQADNLALLAMLREQGELALADGDAKGAEAAWGRMLEMILPAEPARPRRTGTPAGAPAQPRPGSTTPRAPSRSGALTKPASR